MTPLATRLGITPGARVALLHAPDDVEALLQPLPEGVTLQHGLRRDGHVDLIVGFVTERAHLERNIDWLLATLPDDGVFWVAWPDEASKVPTDLSGDVVREVALPRGWVDNEVCAIDATWSALRLVSLRELTR